MKKIKYYLLSIPRHRKLVIITLCDVSLILISTLTAYSLVGGERFSIAMIQLTFSMIAYFLAIAKLEIYNHVMSRSFHIVYQKTIKVLIIFSIAQFVASLLYFGFENLTFTIIQTYVFCALILVSRYIADSFLSTEKIIDSSEARPMLIYGTGVASRRMYSTLKSLSTIKPLAYISLDPSLWNQKIDDLLVMPIDRISEIREQYGAAEIVIPDRNDLPIDSIQIYNYIMESGYRILTPPPIEVIINHALEYGDLKDIEIGEILGRKPVVSDQRLMERSIYSKVVLVTGAGGSIGSEIVRQLIRLSPSKVVLVEITEYALYQIEQELRSLLYMQNITVDIVCVLGDSSHPIGMRNVFSKHKPNIVFHAAAYKHVPMLESNPINGARNNIFSTLNIVKLSVEFNIERFLLVSTDKAVRPTNVMGASKRFSEMIVQVNAGLNSNSVFSIVRFGNVLNSSGSVVPLFKEQLAKGGPLTVTHPEVTRYFMTITEAAQLVVQANSLAENGDLFVLDMGEPVKIKDLAEKMILHYSTTCRGVESTNIEIVYTGLRPGEKLYEELLIDPRATPTLHPKILCARERYPHVDLFEGMIDEIKILLDNYDEAGLNEFFLRTIEGYSNESYII